MRNKNIILSARPIELANIINGTLKSIVRVGKPRSKLPCEVYLYCQKEPPYLFKDRHSSNYYISFSFPHKEELWDYHEYLFNNFILAKFTLNEVLELTGEQKQAALDKYNLLKKKPLKDIKLYEWKIENLVTFPEAIPLHKFKIKYIPTTWSYLSKTNIKKALGDI